MTYSDRKVAMDLRLAVDFQGLLYILPEYTVSFLGSLLQLRATARKFQSKLSEIRISFSNLGAAMPTERR